MGADVTIKIRASANYASVLGASINGYDLPPGLLDVKVEKDGDGLCYAYFKYFIEECGVNVNGERKICSAESLAEAQKMTLGDVSQ